MRMRIIRKCLTVLLGISLIAVSLVAATQEASATTVSKSKLQGRVIWYGYSSKAPCPRKSGPYAKPVYDTKRLLYHGVRKTSPKVNGKLMATGRKHGGVSGAKWRNRYYEGYSQYRLYSGCSYSNGAKRYWVHVPVNTRAKRITTIYYEGGGGATTAYKSTGWLKGNVCAQYVTANWYHKSRKPCVSYASWVRQGM